MKKPISTHFKAVSTFFSTKIFRKKTKNVTNKTEMTETNAAVPPRDRAVLMVCIGIAFCFWLLNKFSMTFQTEEILRIEYRLPRGRSLSYALPDFVKANVELRGWDLLFRRTRNITLDIPNDSQSVISSSQIRAAIAQSLGSDPKIAWISFDQISVKLEAEARKSLRVVVRDSIRFAKGFQLVDSIRVEPEFVVVRGPESLIDKLEFIKTDVLLFEDLNENTTRTIAISDNPILNFDVSEVKAFLEVEQFTEKAMFLPVEIRNARAKSRVFPNRVKLSCVVGLSKFAKVNPQDFSVSVDSKNVKMNAQNNTLPIFVEKKPAFVRNVKCEPNSVEFYFEN
ncbi:MAG: hypothetical protein RL757_1068 [Bacteroidota bacterium]|jgi:hypothetical protein